MKMSDVFKGPVIVDYDYEDDYYAVCDPVDEGEWFSGGEEQINAAAHAINNHDRLVEALELQQQLIKHYADCLEVDPTKYAEFTKAHKLLKEINND